MATQRILVLGGTAWLGREIAREAIARGYDVTCIARGQAGEVAPGATFVRADRNEDGALADLASQRWDAVFDVGRQPGQVRRAVRDLRDVPLYVFVSTCNVYANQNVLGEDETAPLLEPLESDAQNGVSDPDDAYGRRKVACEHAVLDIFGLERALIARSGFIAGPGDVTGRTGYWPLRFAYPSASDGTVLIPDDPDLTTQLVDVRDFAAWLIDAVEADGARGIVNVVGERIPLRDHLAAARRVAGHTGPIARAATSWLVERGVEEFVGRKSLPFWLSDPDWRGFMARDNTRARASGLALRPLEQTLTDVLRWEVGEGPDRPRNSGLSPEDERELLAEHTDGG